MRALFNEGVRQIAAGANAMQLTRGMRQAADLVIDGLRAQARPIAGEDELAAVARTITQEAPLAAVLGEMSYLLGPDAHVSIEKFVAPYLQRRYIGGARSRNAGWRIDYFIVSERLLGHVNDSLILSAVYGSDHCPVCLLAEEP